MSLFDKIKNTLTEQSNSGSGKNKVKFGSGAKGEFASGSASMGGEDKTYVKQGKKPLKGKNVKPGQTTGTSKPKRGATTIRQTGQTNLFTGKVEKPQEVKVKTTYQKKTTKPIRVNPNQGKLNFDSPRQIVKNLDKRDVQIKKLDQQIIKPKSGDAARTDKFIKRKQKSYDIQSKSALKKAKKYAAGGYPKIGGGGLKPDIKPPVKGTTPVKTNVSKLNVDKIFSDKTKTKSSSTVVPKNITPKSKGTTPVKVNITKPVKQSEVSKKAKEFTAKVNKANVNVQKNYVGRKAVRIKDATLGKKTGSLRKGNLSFPGDRSGAYQATKSDIEARKAFKGAKTQTGAGKTKTITALKADEKNPFVKTSVRKGRAANLGGDIFDQPKFDQKKFTDSLKKTTKSKNFVKPPDPFKTSTTKTGSLVKDFKFQPRDLKTSQAAEKAKKSFAQFGKDLKKAKANIEIEKKVNRPSYKISSGSASSGGKSKGTGSRTINVSGSGSGSSSGGGTSSSGSGSGGGGRGRILGSGSSSGSGGSGGGDGSGFRGKYDPPEKPRITGNYSDDIAKMNMNKRAYVDKLSGRNYGGRVVDTTAPGYKPRKIKGYKFFTNKNLNASQRAQKILQGRTIKRSLPKGLKFTKPLIQNIARNPRAYGKAGLVAGAVLGTAAIIKSLQPKPGDLTNKDFAGKVIKNRKGENVRFKYDTYNPTTKSTTSAKNLAGPVITNKELGKFKTGEYKLDGVDLNKRIQNSAFTKQLTKASKGTGFLGRQTDKDRKFLQKYQKAAERRNIKVPTKK